MERFKKYLKRIIRNDPWGYDYKFQCRGHFKLLQEEFSNISCQCRINLSPKLL